MDPWPPTTPCRIHVDRGTVRIENSSNRYYVKVAACPATHHVWGGKKKGNKSIVVAWNEVCGLLGLEPNSQTTKDLVKKSMNGTRKDKTPSAVVASAECAAADVVAVSDAPEIAADPVPVEVEALEDLFEEDDADVFDGEFVPLDYTDASIDDAEPLPLPVVEGLTVPANYLKIRSVLHKEYAVDGDSWIREGYVLDAGKKIFAVMCDGCSVAPWRTLARPWSTMASVPKVTNWSLRGFAKHSTSKLHMRVLAARGMTQQETEGTLLTFGEKKPGPAKVPVTADEVCLSRRVKLFVHTVQTLGTVKDYHNKLTEHEFTNPGQLGVGIMSQTASYVEAAKIQEAADQVMTDNMKAELADADRVSVSADEPKGVMRCGVRFTFLKGDKTRVLRRFWRLAPLHKVFEKNADGVVTATHGPKSAKALWECLKYEMEDAGCLSKSETFVPDGAATFGAQQAEPNEGIAVEGSNVAFLWDSWRRENGLEPLDTSHCTAHRGSLADKDSRDEWLQEYQGILLKQWLHFKETGESAEQLGEIQDDLHLPRTLQPKGSSQKWIGFSESETWDAKNWEAKKIYWKQRVDFLGNGSDDPTRLALDCFKFYNSLENRFVAAGYHATEGFRYPDFEKA